ncbi:MAG: hypothetical protein K8R69_00245 [Deltaproteobacteria bacterium]|nr:hypothetical protein [Deltaproteobacteria bacterium]
MNPEKKTDPKKALKHESKGDKLVGKGKFRDAMSEYQKSEALNPDRVEIYDKLIETQGHLENEWEEEDFANSMTWTMRRQELQNPHIRLVHETFSVEYREVHQLLQRLMMAPNEEQENTVIEKILQYGERAGLPMLHFLLSIKALARQNTEGPQGFEDSMPPQNPPL